MITALQKLPNFDYIKPESIEGAYSFLYEHPKTAFPFLGGTDLLIRLRNNISHAKYLVDLKSLPGFYDIKYDNGLVIGAAIPLNKIISSIKIRKNYHVLVKACESVASYQLRNRATIAGNICNASPAGDTIGACLLYDATLQVYGNNGISVIPLNQFFIKPGMSVLQPGEFVTAIYLPEPDPPIC